MFYIDASILKAIFDGRELTVDSEHSCILNKWSKHEKEIDIPLRTTNYLINNNIILLDSGNFSTGESHYVFNTKIVDIYTSQGMCIPQRMLAEFKSILRELNLNALV